MDQLISIQKLESAFQAVTMRWKGIKPIAAMVLGSGWGDVVQAFNIKDSISYTEIPGLGGASVVGHAGKLHLATMNSKEILIFQGRRHYYEGEGWTPVAVPAFLMKKFGVQWALLTNAAGGLNPKFRPGDLMIIRDHINALGDNPLRGPHRPEFGERFIDLTAVYDAGLREKLAQVVGKDTLQGVYVVASGPSYETPAEIKMFAKLGADAVGMSTVPEATLMHGAGIKVCALSCITNLAAGISPQALSHEEVMDISNKSMGRLKDVIERFFALALA